MTLATGRSGELEEDGEGTSSRKVLKKGGRIQNYTFKLINRATVEESTLSRDTVANIRNEATGAFISTQEVKQGPARPSDEPDDRPISPVESDQEESPAPTPAPTPKKKDLKDKEGGGDSTPKGSRASGI